MNLVSPVAVKIVSVLIFPEIYADKVVEFLKKQVVNAEAQLVN